MTRISLKFALSVLLLALALGGCGEKDPDVLTANDDAKNLYKRAHASLENSRFEVAIQYFHILESRYPFSPYALQAQLELAYAYYRHNKPEETIAEADRFIRFNPTHENVDYAYYIKAMANYQQHISIFERWVPRDAADFNQKPLFDSFNDFMQLIRKFPNSRYAADSRLRMIYLKHKLAEHEIHVARYYVRRGAWVAAVNRCNYILQYFYDTAFNEEALEIMARSYRELNLVEPERNTLKVLRLNFPGNEYLKEHAKS
ncbi:MAG TPA: outer membrane protein assembly factor BamD [Gammaproteobacteria bacterium]|nr:outer membrane protein assembly factor BamD [Gammaproteobacteria bacterium]